MILATMGNRHEKMLLLGTIFAETNQYAQFNTSEGKIYRVKSPKPENLKHKDTNFRQFRYFGT